MLKSIKPKVLFILSTNYAGSHLLAYLVGSHTHTKSMGELMNFFKFINRPSSDHSVHYDFAQNELFEEIPQLQDNKWHMHLLAKIRKQSPFTHCLIDNSKKVKWAKKFINHAEFDSVYVHLIRDPRALVRRWEASYTSKQLKKQRKILMFRSPLNWVKSLFKSQHEFYCYKWLYQNYQISRFLDSRGQSSNVVSYTDLVSNPEETISNVMSMLELDFEKNQLFFGNVMHYGTIKKDYVENLQNSVITEDLRWKNDLEPKTIEMITANKDINNYLGKIYMRWTENGISAI